MSDTSTTALLELVSGRSGHFLLESGHHSRLWLDLDPLFAEPRRIEPFVTKLVEALRPYAIDGVCGPLLGGAFLAQLVAHALGVEFCFTARVMPAQTGTLYHASYQLPAAFKARVKNKRLAIVDDVISAGSALRGTFTELQDHGAVTAVTGALLVLGVKGSGFFAEQDIPVEAAARQAFELWQPTDCPLCASGVELEDVSGSGETSAAERQREGSQI